jgi:GT2 family glycosyltransferase
MADPDNQARLTIIIISWNTLGMTARCLRALEQERSGVGDFQVIVVDNASTDGSAAMVKRDFPWVSLIRNRQNVGFARANNQAIGASQSELVLLLNSDTEVQAGAIGALVAFMRGHPQAGAAGAMLLNADGTLQESCRPMLTPGRELWRLSFLDRLWPRASYRMRAWDTETARPVEVMMGACMMLRRRALDQVGALDEQFFMYTEEVDLCHRLSAGRWQLWYVPAARVTHYGGASSRQVAQEMFVQLYRSKVQFYRKTGGEQLARRFKRMLRLAYWPRLVIARLLAPVSSTSAGQAARYASLLRELAGM